MKGADRDPFRIPVARCLALIVVSVAVHLVPGTSVAQEAPPALEFSFSNPGARSMGLGGAFVALADDATAAFANPAGLVQLVRPEISLELRRREYSTPYTEGGRAVGPPTGYGIDTVDGLRTSFSNETTSGLSFLSFVYPGTKWSLALYRHQLADFSVSTEINGLFGDVPEGRVRRYEDQRTVTELDVVGTGLSGAYQVSDKLSLGFGLSYFSGRVENRGAIHLIDSDPDTFWEWNSFLPDRLFATSSFDADDTDVGFNVGVLWKFAESWRLGGVYRKGPRFDYELYNLAGPANDLPEGTILGAVTDRSIAFPDVWGLGVAYRSSDGSLTVGFEWDRVEYSIIGETLDSPLVDASQVAIDDADELHLGAEYVFLKTTPLIAIRGGLWHDPDHRFRYEGDDPFARALYQPGEDALHISIGAGIAFSRFQIDVGANLSDAVDQFALSAIFSF
jgi:long-subunit fatty acid transport protein